MIWNLDDISNKLKGTQLLKKGFQGVKSNRGLSKKNLSVRKVLVNWKNKNNGFSPRWLMRGRGIFIVLLVILLYLFKDNSIFINVFNLLWINKESIILGYCLIGAIIGFIFNGINYIVFKVIYLNPNIKIIRVLISLILNL